jgi:hypothetical protein
MTVHEDYANPAFSAKEITEFRFDSLEGESVVVDEAEKTVTITVPPGADITNLIPTLIRTGIGSYSPQGPQDFTSDVIFTITAVDGSSQQYTVHVEIENPAASPLTGTINIEGNPTVGQTLTANTENLNGSGTISYQWLREGMPISGASNQAYILVSADQGKTILVQVSRSGNTGTVSSAPTAEIAYPALTGTIAIIGNPIVGQTLTTNTGSLNGSGTISYQWLREGTPISGASDQTYTLVSADQGKTISVRVSRSGNTGTISSETIGPVATEDTPIVLTGTVTINGAPVVGTVLTAVTSALNGSGTISYQWLREGTPVNGAVDQTYTLDGDDQSHTISVQVSRSGTTGFVTSLPTTEVAYPALTGTLTILGDPIVEQTLTANPVGFNGSGPYTYQWRRGESNISGATSRTYTLTNNEVGYSIRVRVSRGEATGTVTSTPTTEVTYPVLTGTVAITGAPIVGQTLTANTGTFNGSGSLLYQWVRGETNIAGAVNQTYTLVSADFDKIIKVRINRDETTGFISSGPTAAIAYPALSGTLMILGAPIVGQTLTANADGFNGAGIIFYQWLRGGSPISGASGQTYILVSADLGQTITVQVSRLETTGFASSAPTAVVDFSAIEGTVTILGDAIAGETLTVNADISNGVGSYFYQWLRGGSPINGASDQTYVLTNVDQSYIITVQVTRAETAGNKSASTAAVVFPALNGTVVISGTTTVGQTLTAAPSELNGIGDGAVSYQWLRGGSTPIGTNSSAYTIANADQGSAISVRITRNYTTGNISSAPTATVVFPALSGTVTISGTTIVGQTLTAVPGGLNGIGDGAVSYQWIRGESTSIGTDSNTYTLVAADEGKTIHARVTRNYTTGTLTSASTAVVVFPVISGTVTISGTATVGQTLTANVSIANGSGPYSYQWLRGGSTSIGTNSSSYTLVNADLGQTIQALITRSETTGNISSAATSVVLAQPQGTVTFTFTGPGDENINLTNQALSWTANTPLSLTVSGAYTSYQWSLDGTPLSGATTANLSRTARNFSIGTHNLSVRVTNTGGTPYSKELTITVSN